MKKIIFLFGIFSSIIAQAALQNNLAYPSIDLFGDWEDIQCQFYTVGVFGKTHLQFEPGGKLATKLYHFYESDCAPHEKKLMTQANGYYQILQSQLATQGVVYEIQVHTPTLNAIQRKIAVLQNDILLLCNRSQPDASCQRFQRTHS